MSERQHLGVQDALWLEMDRPTNLMVVDALVWTGEPADWDRFADVAKERLWDRYAVFRSVAVRDGDGWWWEERGDDSFDTHITRLRLPEPGGDAELQEFVASQRTAPLDRSSPLWKMFFIDGFHGGSAMLIRTHHAIADGIRMVQLAMSLFDAAPEGGAILAPPAANGSARDAQPARSFPDRFRDEVDAVAHELTDLTKDLGHQIGHAISHPIDTARSGLEAVGEVIGEASHAAERMREFAAGSVTNPIGAMHGAAEAAAAAAETTAARLRHAFRPRVPGEGPLVDMFSSRPR